MLRYFFLIFLFFRCLLASEFEEFYIFPMGQGNGQLMIYSNGVERVPVLYDLGSKSLQMHPKLASHGEWDLRFRNIQVADLKAKEVFVDFDGLVADYDDVLFTPTKMIKVAEPFSLNAKLSTPQREILKRELQNSIYEKLIGLKHLFIFLSHSDEDHINFINSDTIPDDTPVTMFFAGDWFGNVGCERNKTNVTKAVKGVLAFLKGRVQNNLENIHFNFPYYNNFFIVKDDKSIGFNEFIKQGLIEREIDGSFLNELSAYCLRTKIDAPIPEFFSGNFTDLYNSVFSEASAHASTSASHGLKTAAAVDATEDFEEYVKRHIHIWSLNHQTDDINGHSMVVSCTLPTLNMSIVLTGDALHSVFQRIVSHYKKQNFRQILGSKFPILIHSQHIVTFMLPHHASDENSSGTALRFFTPDVFGIPAGDGGQYGHPSLSLIQNIDNLYAEKTGPNNFRQKYVDQKSLDFIAIQDNNQVLSRAISYTVPFLCPNVYGTIRWDKNGIFTNFDNLLEIGKNRYNILYSSHVWEANKGILKKMKESSKKKITVLFAQDIKKEQLMDIVERVSKNPDNYKCIIRNPKTKELFAGVPVGDKLYFYKLISADV